MTTAQLTLLVFAIVLLGAGSRPESARALETFGGNVVVERTVNNDLVAAGRDMEIRAPIKGDLAAAGATVSIEQAVAGYVMAVGRTVEVNGPVQNDLWAAGASVAINSSVGDNAMLAGREVNLHSSAAVRGDARIAAGTVDVKGPVRGNLGIAARTAQIGSEVGGSVDARVQRLKLLPGAVIRGDLIVRGSHPPEISPNAPVLGKIQFNKIAAGNHWSWLWWWFFSFTALLTLGFGALALSPGWANHVAGMIRARPGASALTGLMGLLLVPIIAGLLLVTVIGIPLAVILLALYVVAILLSGVFVDYLIGGWLLSQIQRGNTSPWARIAVGALVVSLLMSLPWIGGIVQLIVLLIGFGALVLEQRESKLGFYNAESAA